MLNLGDGRGEGEIRREERRLHFIAIPGDLVRMCRKWRLLRSRRGGRRGHRLRGAWGSHWGWGSGREEGERELAEGES